MRKPRGIDVTQADLSIEQVIDGDLRLHHQTQQGDGEVVMSPVPEEPRAAHEPDHVGAEARQRTSERRRARRRDHARAGAVQRVVRGQK
jgi:hypothetical protein